MTNTSAEWTSQARERLLRLRGAGGAWGYRRDGEGCVEPSVLAALALGHDSMPALEVADWLARNQRADGSLGPCASQPAPGWMTPYAILLWLAQGRHEDAARRAGDWLLGVAGKTIRPVDDPEHIVGHDATLVGWPWVADTHSWLEPTALAVLALQRLGLSRHPRVREGFRLIRDRAIAGGGWNYGNKSVFGRSLRPQPAPSGIALLTLAGEPGPTDVVEPAIAYLERVLPGLHAPASLAWGLMGLSAWGRRPSQADAWLRASFESIARRDDAAMRVALLLMAEDARRLEDFGRGASPPSVVQHGQTPAPLDAETRGR